MPSEMTASLTMMHMLRCDVNARLISLRTLMVYLVVCPNGKESVNKFLSPDPGPDPVHLEENRQTDPNALCKFNC